MDPAISGDIEAVSGSRPPLISVAGVRAVPAPVVHVVPVADRSEGHPKIVEHDVQAIAPPGVPADVEIVEQQPAIQRSSRPLSDQASEPPRVPGELVTSLRENRRSAEARLLIGLLELGRGKVPERLREAASVVPMPPTRELRIR